MTTNKQGLINLTESLIPMIMDYRCLLEYGDIKLEQQRTALIDLKSRVDYMVNIQNEWTKSAKKKKES